MALVAFLVPWVALVLLACGVAASTAWLATRRAASNARAALRARGSDVAVLRGKLRVEGKRLEGDWGGTRVLAAVSPIHSRSRLWPRRAIIVGGGERCEALWLDTADGSIRLDGPLGVEAGTRQRWQGYATRDDHGKWFAGDFAVFDGDEVVVAGVRTSAPQSGTPSKVRYRESATHQSLSPLSNGALAVAAVHASPSLSPRQLLRLPAVVLFAMAALYPAYASYSELSETEAACVSACRDHGGCAVAIRPWWDVVEHWKRALQGDVYRCVARSDADCHGSISCLRHGQCSEREGRCIAASDDDCHFTIGCLQSGLCGSRDGACAALRDEHCRELSSCADHGSCSARDGFCSVGSDADCAASSYCRSIGSCSRVADACGVGKDEDCEKADPCTKLGQCSARNGSCINATTADCRRGYDCRADGRCSFVEGEGCEVTGDDDCLFSESCAQQTRCRAVDGECASDGPCPKSAACRVHGHCEGDFYCSPRSDADCAQSEGCKQRGACKYLSGGCSASCAARDACKSEGLCSVVDEHLCGAAKDEDCRQSEACRADGRCTARGGKCVAQSAGDCRRSTACRWDGRCTLTGDACQASGDDCFATRHCRSIGFCEAQEGHCVQGRGSDYCRQSPLCKKLGRCTWHTHQCTVFPSDEDCKKSEVCQRYGWCNWVDEDCFISG